MSKYGIRKANYGRCSLRERLREQFKYWIIMWVYLFDSLVTILSAGYLTSDYRLLWLFEDD